MQLASCKQEFIIKIDTQGRIIDARKAAFEADYMTGAGISRTKICESIALNSRNLGLMIENLNAIETDDPTWHASHASLDFGSPCD